MPVENEVGEAALLVLLTKHEAEQAFSDLSDPGKRVSPPGRGEEIDAAGGVVDTGYTLETLIGRRGRDEGSFDRLSIDGEG